MTEDSRKGFGATRKWSDEPLVLFVEGYSDLTFYAELLEHIEIFSPFIQNLGGKGRGKLRDEAKLLLKPDNLAKMKAIAIILDADGSAEQSFAGARDAIRSALELDIDTPGKWFEESRTNARFGIYIVAGPDGTGEVESLAWDAWQSKVENARLKECVEEFTRCAAAAGLTLRNLDKTRIGAALSILNEDDPRLGAGARANKFDFESAQFKNLREFFLEVKPIL